MKKFEGTGVAIVTPFKNDLSIDFSAMEILIENLILKEVDYLVVMGTTGESATLTKEEKKQIKEFVIDKNKNRLPIVLGIGGNCTKEIVETIKNTDFQSIDAILSVSPYYNKPQQDGIFLHYKAIADASPLPIILYNVPSRTSVNISYSTTLRIAKACKNVIGIKEASGNLEQISNILKYKNKDFLVISGDDTLTLALIAMGASGVISVTANALPYEYSQMTRACLDGNFKKARKINFEIFEIIETLFQDGNPSGIKASLKILGIIKNNLRLPLVKVKKEVYLKLKNLLKK